MTIEITLTGKYSNGKITLIDDEDYDKVKNHTCNFRKDGYVYAKIYQKHVPLHRFIMNITYSNIQIDHKNHNKLDNRKENLRICSRRQNLQNSRKFKGISPFKGVKWHKKHIGWYSEIKYSKKKIYIGTFSIEEEAAKAYDIMAIVFFGEFACLNFPNFDYKNYEIKTRTNRYHPSPKIINLIKAKDEFNRKFNSEINI